VSNCNWTGKFQSPLDCSQPVAAVEGQLSNQFVRNIILGGALAPSVDRSMEDHVFWVCLNSEMGRAWLQLKRVAPTCASCPICRRSKKGVPAGTERSLSSGRMGEDKGKELRVRREREEGKSKLIFKLIIYYKVCT
jgi:hypothetical protein